MKYIVNYESEPGMWELYNGIKKVEAESEEEAIDKAYRLIQRDFRDRPRNGWRFSIKSRSTD